MLARDFNNDPVSDNRLRIHAVGKALSACTLRCMCISLISPNRNTVFLFFTGIPFERALKWHKMAGRLQMCFMYMHIILMLISGTEVGYVAKLRKNIEYHSAVIIAHSTILALSSIF